MNFHTKNNNNNNGLPVVVECDFSVRMMVTKRKTKKLECNKRTHGFSFIFSAIKMRTAREKKLRKRTRYVMIQYTNMCKNHCHNQLLSSTYRKRNALLVFAMGLRFVLCFFFCVRSNLICLKCINKYTVSARTQQKKEKKFTSACTVHHFTISPFRTVSKWVRAAFMMDTCA